MTGLDAFFAPSTIAVIGASDDTTRIGGRAVRNLLTSGYAGRIVPVNPHRDIVQGLLAVPSVSAVEGSVDLALVLVSAAAAISALRECGNRGVRAAIVFSSGFGEAGPEGRERQKELDAIVAATGMRVLGPNCLGLWRAGNGVTATFSSSIERTGGVVIPGSIGFVSQSGAFCSHCFAAATGRGFGFSTWVTTGNESDVDFAECLAYVVEDPETTVVIGYLEGCGDGRRLAGALERAQELGKPVILMKVGGSDVGAQATASHTAAMAGDDAVFDAVFARYGVIRARTVEEMLTLAEACAQGVLPSNGELGIVTGSGGIGILMADRAAQHPVLSVPALPAAAQERLAQRLPGGAVRNPVDFTAQIANEPTLAAECLDAMLSESDLGSVVVFVSHTGLSDASVERVCGPLAEVRARYPDRLVVVSALTTPHNRRRLVEWGFVVVEDPSAAVDLVAALASSRTPRLERAAPAIGQPEPPAGHAGEHASKELLAAIGVPSPAERLVLSAEQAIAAARELGEPVVMKIASPQATHKSEVGGVHLGVAGDAEIARTFDELVAVAAAHWPGAGEDGVLVCGTAPRGVETIVGFHRDPVFGPMLTFGLGGVAAEALKDVTLSAVPIGLAEARAMIGRIRAHALLEGFRGAPRADTEALAASLVAISQLAVHWGDRVDSLEVNPLVVLPEGQGVLALDALVVPSTPTLATVGA